MHGIMGRAAADAEAARSQDSNVTNHQTYNAPPLVTEDVTVMPAESLQADTRLQQSAERNLEPCYLPKTLEASSNIDIENRHAIQPATHPHGYIMERGLRDHRSNEDKLLRWDKTVVDKVLYLFAPLMLLKCGLILLFVITPLAPPHMSISCWHPADFSADWRAYGDQYCLSKVKNGSVYKSLTDEIPSHDEQAPDYNQIFNQTVYPSPPVVLTVFVMAMMCVLPSVVWRSFGQVDALELIIKDSREGGRVPFETRSEPRCFQKSDSIQCIGFVGSKLLAAGICLIMLVLISVINEQGRQYTLKNEEYTAPKDELIICDFSVRRLGDNLHRYTVQCIASSNRDEPSVILHLLDLSHIILPLLRSLAVLLVLVFLSQVANALIITMALLRSFRRPFRQLIINRYGGEQEQIITDVMDEMIGPYGVFVTVMAVRCGETQRITEIYHTVAASAKLELNKLD